MCAVKKLFNCCYKTRFTDFFIIIIIKTASRQFSEHLFFPRNTYEKSLCKPSAVFMILRAVSIAIKNPKNFNEYEVFKMASIAEESHMTEMLAVFHVKKFS